MEFISEEIIRHGLFRLRLPDFRGVSDHQQVSDLNRYFYLFRSIICCETVPLSLFNNVPKLGAAVAFDKEVVEGFYASGRMGGCFAVEGGFDGGGCHYPEYFVHFFGGVWHVVVEPPGDEG